MTNYIFEFIGTMVLILLGDGVCAATSLNHSKAKGAGWVVIAMGWGFAVMVAVFISGAISGAHLNPAVSIGCALAGTMAWSAVPGYVIAQMLGGLTGAVLVWLFYKDHYDATEDPDTKLGTFCIYLYTVAFFEICVIFVSFKFLRHCQHGTTLGYGYVAFVCYNIPNNTGDRAACRYVTV